MGASYVWLLMNVDLVFNITGTLLIAFSVGVPSAYTDILVDEKKGKAVKIAAILSPARFKWGCSLLILGFIITTLLR